MATRAVELGVRANELKEGDVFVNTASSGSPGFTPTYQAGDRIESVSEVRNHRVTVKAWRRGGSVQFELVWLARPLIRRTEEYVRSVETQEEIDYAERLDPGNRTGWER